jgi:type II secretory pathway pseudopilin PulG
MFNKIIKKNRFVSTLSNKGGFTLVETMFAVFILTFVIVGLMTVVANSLFAARYARDEITANYLLQEAIDYIRNDRDTSVFLNGVDWDTFYSRYGGCHTPNGCSFDLTKTKENSVISTCPTDGCTLYYNDNADITPFYINSPDGAPKGSVETKFKRKIIVTQGQDNEIIVKVSVLFKNGGIDRERILTTSLTNWQAQPSTP